MVCAELERPDWLREFGCIVKNDFRIDKKAEKFLMDRSPQLQRVAEILAKIEPATNDHKFVKPIENLNIPGLLIRRQRDDRFFIDVLEETSRMSMCGNVKPFGLLQLKLNLIRATSKAEVVLVKMFSFHL